jgi:hypothetical protein
MYVHEGEFNQMSVVAGVQWEELIWMEKAKRKRVQLDIVQHKDNPN